MVVRIRLAMHGRRHNHLFHLVAINNSKARDAKPIEKLGIYDPAMTLGEKHKTVEWSVDRIKYWLGVGAVPSKTVVRLLEVGGVIPPDSKYHPKNLGPRVPPPTVPLDSLKARTLWENLSEHTSKGRTGEGLETAKGSGNSESVPPSSPPPLGTISASPPP